MKLFQFLFMGILAFSTLNLAALEFQEADIVIPEKNSAYWRFCGEELSRHLSRITGKKFPVMSRPQAGQRVKIFLGVLPDPSLKRDKETLNGDGFYTVVTDRAVYIAGLDTHKSADRFVLLITLGYKGTLFGVYDFLERCGVRFPAPGEANTFCPAKSKIQLTNGTTKNVPAFRGRALPGLWKFSNFPDGGEYAANADEMMLWALRHKSNYPQLARGCHTEQFLRLPEIWWKDHPERFQLMRNGKRNPRYLCWTNPAVKETWRRSAMAFFNRQSPAEAGLPHLKNFRGQQIPDEFMIDPMDHGSSNDGRCRCPSCAEFHRKTPCADDTEILWQVISGIAREVRKEFPGKYISTLIYPPKQQFPRTVQVPDNMRVRLCLNGAKIVPTEKILNRELAALKQWSGVLGRDNTCVWLYQCEIHGGKLPGPPETYLEDFGKYLQMIRPYCNEVFQEYHALNFTYRHFDSYAEMKLMWDPTLDVAALKKEFFALYYGAAAPEMLAIFNDFDACWQQYWSLASSGMRAAEIGLSKNGPELRKIAWEKVYTPAKLQHWNFLLAQALQKTAPGAVVGKRVALVKKYLLDRMTEERRLVMNLGDSAPRIQLNAQPWSKQKVYSLIPAGKLIRNLRSPATAQLRLENGKLQVKLQISEAANAPLVGNPVHRDGSEELWQDCTVELFFSQPESRAVTQLIFTLNGRKTMRSITPVETKLSASVPGSCRIRKIASGYEFFYETPLSELTRGKALPLLFNLTREHRVKGREPEYSTFSPASILGYWDNPESFARLFAPSAPQGGLK